MSNRLAGSGMTPVFSLNLGGERFFVSSLYSSPRVAEGIVVRHRLERAQLLQIARPTIADRVRHQLRQPGIGQHDETPRGHAIRHIEEFLRPKLAEISQHAVPEQLAVKSGDAV